MHVLWTILVSPARPLEARLLVVPGCSFLKPSRSGFRPTLWHEQVGAEFPAILAVLHAPHDARTPLRSNGTKPYTLPIIIVTRHRAVAGAVVSAALPYSRKGSEHLMTSERSRVHVL